jgi:hypothetical protein
VITSQWCPPFAAQTLPHRTPGQRPAFAPAPCQDECNSTLRLAGDGGLPTLRFESVDIEMGQLDVGAWVGIITLALALPVGVMGHVLGHRVLLHLEKRKLVKVMQPDDKPFGRITASNHSTTAQETDTPTICCSRVRL